jgi:hypothetical protein
MYLDLGSKDSLLPVNCGERETTDFRLVPASRLPTTRLSDLCHMSRTIIPGLCWSITAYNIECPWTESRPWRWFSQSGVYQLTRLGIPALTSLCVPVWCSAMGGLASALRPMASSAIPMYHTHTRYRSLSSGINVSSIPPSLAHPRSHDRRLLLHRSRTQAETRVTPKNSSRHSSHPIISSYPFLVRNLTNTRGATSRITKTHETCEPSPPFHRLEAYCLLPPSLGTWGEYGGTT